MIGAIIQARKNSKRFPQKILKKLPMNSELTVLDQVILRTKQCKKLDKIILATTDRPEDDEIEAFSIKYGIESYRGDEEDVLKRYYEAAKKFNLDSIVRITSDCPCIDSNIIDHLVQIFLSNSYDYVSNTIERTFPHGLDTEVFTFQSLEKAYRESKGKENREHVTYYLYNSGLFTVYNLKAAPADYDPKIRITLDTKQDYTLLCAVFDYLYSKNKFFNCSEIINLFKSKQWLYQINHSISQKLVPKTEKEEILEAVSVLERQELLNAKKILEEYSKRY